MYDHCIISEINTLRKKKNVVILAHYYQRPEVQEIADFVGDSLQLSEQAAATDASIIVFAGVHFMAETAKILSPAKKVLLPDLNAGCSLAESCRPADFRRFIAAHPEHTVISYVNTSAEIKAMTDICCTSSNALKIVESLPVGEKIIFGPDRNLGNYIKTITGREDMQVWDGACHVHEAFSVERLAELKQQRPAAKVVAHPECKKAVLLLADFIGSTAALLHFTQYDKASQYIVVTEPGVIFQMQKASPQKEFIPLPVVTAPSSAFADDCGACNDCQFMKLITLEKIHRALQTEQPEIFVEETIREKAERSIRRMLERSK
ncbi:MAG: quinolinate synthase NadA [Prevotellaceae bacterium]|jgi:quinolinate synthase|nr:quinolinate synthase NadA [Prevotellaceae bacterium]